MTSYRMKYKIGNTAYIIPSMDDLSGFSSGGGVPLGTILPYSADSPTPPEGFSFCDGTAVSRSLYADLFGLIGTSYGAGDGETTFNLPDLTDAAWLNGSYEKTAYETAGNYTFTVTKPGWYKITIKGAGGGGGGGKATSGHDNGGGGGGEGGTTFAYEKMTSGDTVSIIIGAGGTGGVGNNAGVDGGNTSVSVNEITYTAGGGYGGWTDTITVTSDSKFGKGGFGTIPGNAGQAALVTGKEYDGSSGGGAGGGISLKQMIGKDGIMGAGGGGGYPTASTSTGGSGGDGYCWIEYIGTSQNFIIRTFDEATPSPAQIDLSQYTNALNNKADKADGVPVGTVLPFSGNGSLPAGYLLCDGSAVSRSMYEDLFGVIGTTYGEGDGVETFNLPDLGFIDSDSAEVYGDAGKAMQLNCRLPSAKDSNLTASDGQMYWISGTGLSWSTAGSVTEGINIASKESGIDSRIYTDLSSAVSNKVRYIIKAFNGMNTHGALLDLTGMANELNKKFGDHELYGENFTIIYPNGGSAENPANITTNSRYVEANPFPGYYVYCRSEIYAKNQWNHMGFGQGSTSASYGVHAEQTPDENSIIVLGGITALGYNGNWSSTNNPSSLNTTITSAPVRVKVWKIGKI